MNTFENFFLDCMYVDKLPTALGIHITCILSAFICSIRAKCRYYMETADVREKKDLRTVAV